MMTVMRYRSSLKLPHSYVIIRSLVCTHRVQSWLIVHLPISPAALSLLRIQGHSVKEARFTPALVTTAAAEPAAGEPVPASVQYQLLVNTGTDTLPQHTPTWILNSAEPRVSGCVNHTMTAQKLSDSITLNNGSLQAMVFLRQGEAAQL